MAGTALVTGGNRGNISIQARKISVHRGGNIRSGVLALGRGLIPFSRP